MSETLTFPQSRFVAFMQQYRPEEGLRLGQAFHQFMNLEKCVQDKAFCDRLYNAPSDQAKEMIRARLDHQH